MLTNRDLAYIRANNHVISAADRCVSGKAVHFKDERTARIVAGKHRMQVLHAPRARFPWIARP